MSGVSGARPPRNDAAKTADAASAIKLSVNDFVIKALALALQRVPAANAVWAEDRILRFRRSDIAVAVAIEDGLVTPVVRGAESKSLSVISAEMKDLAARARQRKLKANEIQGGATAISNLGMQGIREFAAIISPPHATILAVGAAARRPVETADGGFRFVRSFTSQSVIVVPKPADAMVVPSGEKAICEGTAGSSKRRNSSPVSTSETRIERS